MKLIKVTDRNNIVHHINPTYIARIEDHTKMIIIITTDGSGIRSDITFVELMGLLAG